MSPFTVRPAARPILRCCPNKNAKEWLAPAFDKQNPQTIDTAENLLAELAKIRRQGYAVDNEEFHNEMVAIAVPVTDLNGDISPRLPYMAPAPFQAGRCDTKNRYIAPGGNRNTADAIFLDIQDKHTAIKKTRNFSRVF